MPLRDLWSHLDQPIVPSDLAQCLQHDVLQLLHDIGAKVGSNAECEIVTRMLAHICPFSSSEQVGPGSDATSDGQSLLQTCFTAARRARQTGGLL